MHAPGGPGIQPTWTSSAKDLVGCGLNGSRVWFTIGRGILNEVYYPRADIPQIRDLGFIVSDNNGFWCEVKRQNDYRVETPGSGVPAADIRHRHPRFELRLRVVPDPRRDVILVAFDLSGDEALRPFVLLAPHLGGEGGRNQAEVARYHGWTVLWAEQGPFAAALVVADHRQGDALGPASAGYVGENDGWQDFSRHGAMTWHYSQAGPGNVALMGMLPRRGVLALGFGTSRESAATLARSALAQPFDLAWDIQADAWRQWHENCQQPELPLALRRQAAVSAMVLKVHQDKTYPGAMVASLSIPWGNSKDDIGGYHLVWPRDLVESAGALLALDALDEARDTLRYLLATQHEEGYWAQNQWLGGKAYWHGLQLDEAAFPVLLAAALAERDALDGIQVQDMVKRALSFIARQGPATDQDRWEEDAGINTFTLAVCIAALVSGAQFLNEPDRPFALDLADYWNGRIEDWTYTKDSRLARRFGVPGHYVRVAPLVPIWKYPGLTHILPIKNLAEDPGLPAEEQVGVDFLQLVRFGLRRADDPAIRDSLKVADSLLRLETDLGPVWHRYNGDGYGEHEDGSPFDGTGVGRAWPLLTGERGHYELAAGGDAMACLRALSEFSSPTGLIPEQVWDASPEAGHPLEQGRPTGSAMPLVWAHAEFIKLAASLALGRPFDRPTAVWKRYGGRRPRVSTVFWGFHFRPRTLPAGARLVLCLPRPALVRWGTSGWQNPQDMRTGEPALGLHLALLPVTDLPPGDCVDFTFRWDQGYWEGEDFRVEIEAPAS